MTRWAPCDSCAHKGDCWSSAWNGGSASGTPPGYEHPEGGLENLTCVHTCFTCGLKVFDRFIDGEESRLEVPDDCPRWNPAFGSATDCEVCRGERDAVRKQHPNYDRQMEVASAFLQRLLTAGTDELIRKRTSKEIAKQYTDADNPMHWLPQFMAEHPKAVEQGDVLLNAVVASIVNHKGYIPQWSKLTDDQQKMLLARWAEAAMLACSRHKDPDRVAWEMWLTVSDAPGIRRASLTPSERELMRRGWAAALTGSAS